MLRDELRDAPRGTLTIIDEVQKVPALLDEVHWLIENRKLVFALCGSSARNLSRSNANLLGGRAERYELSGLVSEEIGPTADLVRMANHGVLPRHHLSDSPARLMRAYVDDYLKAGVYPSSQTARDSGAKVLFRRCGCGESAGTARRGRDRQRTLWQGARESGAS